MAKDYSAKDIDLLEGLEPVRVRPGMYIGGTDLAGLHHLVWEVVDNSVDEAINGYCDRITITIGTDGGLMVEDNGRGIPIDKHPKHKKPALEIIMTTLHSGAKFSNKSYTSSGGLHGVGVSVVNALSERMEVVVKRGGRGGARSSGAEPSRPGWQREGGRKGPALKSPSIPTRKFSAKEGLTAS